MYKHLATLSIAAVLGFISSAPAFAEASLQTGDLVKTENSSAVYEIDTDGSRLVFQMQSVYESWYGNDFSAVQTISEDQLASLPLRKVKSFKPGTLVKSPSLPRVYIVDTDLSLSYFVSEEEFLSEGHSFADIKDIPDAFFTSYTVAGPAVEDGPSKPLPVEDIPEEDPIEFSVVSRTFTPESSSLGLINVQTSINSTVEITYAVQASVIPEKKQVSDDLQTSHTFTLSNLQPAAKYDYTLRVTNPDETLIIEESGTFVSYYDVYLSAHGSAPNTGTLRQADVEVGRYFLYNNSDTERTVTEKWLSFMAANKASDDVAKTIKIIDVTPGSPTEGEVITSKNISKNTSFRNATNMQKFTFLDIDIAPGQQKIYSVVITNLENMAASKMNGDTFETVVSKIIFGGNNPVQYTENDTVGTRIHQVVE